MDFNKSMSVAASGMRAQADRMRIIAENIANANSTSPVKGGDP
jgi:flagellar basal-body rod protein FlgC